MSISFGSRPIFDGGTQRYKAALGTRNSSFNEQQLTLSVHTKQIKILDCDGFAPQVPRHLFSGENPSRILGHADRTRNIMRATIAMRSALRPKVMTLYRTRITLADRCSLNIHFLTARKYIRKRQNGPCGIFTRHRLINAKFTNNLSSLHSCFREVTRLRLGNTR